MPVRAAPVREKITPCNGADNCCHYRAAHIEREGDEQA